jgi:hypothetical protein
VRVAARLSGILRSTAALAVFGLLLAGGSAYATLIAGISSVTTSNGTVIKLLACNGGTACTNTAGDTLSLSANGQGATLTGSATGSNGSSLNVFESVTSGSVDTYLLFSITSPIQSTSVGIYATGCGGNTTGCAQASNSNASATATISAATAYTLPPRPILQDLTH